MGKRNKKGESTRTSRHLRARKEVSSEKLAAWTEDESSSPAEVNSHPSYTWLCGLGLSDRHTMPSLPISGSLLVMRNHHIIFSKENYVRKRDLLPNCLIEKDQIHTNSWHFWNKHISLFVINSGFQKKWKKYTTNQPILITWQVPLTSQEFKTVRHKTFTSKSHHSDLFAWNFMS